MLVGSMEVEPPTLLPVVRRSTGRPRLELGPWSVQAVDGGAGRGLGIWRVSGEGVDAGEPVSWSVVVKQLGREGGAESPGGWDYWRREADAYASGLLGDLPGGLRAPRCLGVHEVRSGVVGLWLEDVDGAGGADWTVADLGAVAVALGELNGGYVGRLPDLPWLSRDWLRHYVEYNAWAVDLLRASADDRWVRRMFPPDEVRATLGLWDDRGWGLAILARLPRTLCHMDAFSKNLFRGRGVDGQPCTIAVDWAFVGEGAVGEEIAPLVVASATLGGVDVDVADLEDNVVRGYHDGLSSAGLDCDDRLVRLGYAVACCLRYVIGPLETLVPVLLDEERRAWSEQLLGMPFADVCERFLTFRREVLWPLLLEARALERELELL